MSVSNAGFLQNRRRPRTQADQSGGMCTVKSEASLERRGRLDRRRRAFGCRGRVMGESAVSMEEVQLFSSYHRFAAAMDI